MGRLALRIGRLVVDTLTHPSRHVREAGMCEHYADLCLDSLALARQVGDGPLVDRVVARDERHVASSYGAPNDPLAVYNLIISSDFSPPAPIG